MDGEQVKAWEAQCIEEQPPACTMACPLRLDARAMLEKVAQGDLIAAFAVYCRHVPFPAILSHICEAPCQQACRRAEAGGSLAVRAIEQLVVEEGYATLRRVAQVNRKPKRLAVVGAGLAGLTAAHDLAMKGHKVTVFEADALAFERLRHDYADRLPEAAVEAELGALMKLGVDIRCRSRVTGDGGPLGIDAFLAAYEAVLLALGPGPAPSFAAALVMTDNGRIRSDPDSCATSIPKVFATGIERASGAPYSPVGSMRHGRRAAASIDRFLQGASLTANRASDEIAQSRLYVNVAAHASVAPVTPADPAGGFTHAEAIAEAKRCFPCHCLECVKACEYLKQYGAYPKRYVRDMYNNISIIKGNRKYNRVIDSCTLCGLCETICPNDLSMADVCLSARQDMVATGHMPASHHDFALRDMAFSRSDAFTLHRHQPGRDASATLFFPGCQLSASSPEHVERIYAHLTQTLPGGVGLMLDCCGAPAHWSGRVALGQEVNDGLRHAWDGLGRPQVITACSSCQKMLGQFHPEMTVTSLWSVIAETGWPQPMPGQPMPDLTGRRLAIHDPCTARHAPEVQRAARDLAARLGAEVRELSGAELTTCCGYGGLASFANRTVADRILDARAAESADDYLTYCAMCRDSFARRGKRAVHLLDLAFGQSGLDAAGRPDPGFSLRRDNRARLKTRLVRELWGEAMDDPTVRGNLVIADDVLADMERKLILVEDVARVVAAAEAGGPKLVDRRTGHILASAQFGSFTCWVEYQHEAGGYRIHRAYSHRMSVEAKP
ncbi:MAG: heterodisulfide reductase-related iron-sulfur binding cluster [Ancalomicrobiaceae bacterium]|nr:heterodisulfide reductase-related iron-sulfur binding cluster [Ancalomicrobiaceae bacterium]